MYLNLQINANLLMGSSYVFATLLLDNFLTDKEGKMSLLRWRLNIPWTEHVSNNEAITKMATRKI